MKYSKTLLKGVDFLNSLEADDRLVYDPLKSPPDFNISLIHYNANRVYAHKEFKPGEAEKIKKCPCCGVIQDGEWLPLMCDLESLYHLGVGFPMHFLFIKYAIALLLLFFFISGLYNILSNALSGDCSSRVANDGEFCDQNYIILFTWANKRNHDDLLGIQPILNIITVLLSLFYFQYLRRDFHLLAYDADDKSTTHSDYSVKVAGIPTTMTNKELSKWIESLSTKKIKVEKVTRAYKIKEYMKFYDQMAELEKKHEYVRKPEIKAEIKLEMSKVDAKMKEIKDKIELTGIAFVSLHSAQEAEHLLEICKRRPWKHIWDCLTSYKNSKLRLEGKNVKIERAPEPKDINWRSLGFSLAERRTKRFLSFSISFGFIAVEFISIVLINWVQDSVTYSGGSTLAILSLSILSSAMIFIYDFVMSLLIRRLSEIEERSTYTRKEIGVAIKLILNSFFASSGANFFAKLMIHSGEFYFSLNHVNFYGEGGLLQNMFFVFIFGAVLSPILHILDPKVIYQRYRQRYELKHPNESKMIQSQSQELFEGRKLDISVQYSEIMRIMFLAGFYGAAMPMGMIIGVIGLFISYWIKKYLLLRDASRPPPLGKDLSIAMTGMLEWFGFFFSVGNLLFANDLVNLEGEKSYPSLTLLWVPFVISLAQMASPMEKINTFLCPLEKKAVETMNYIEACVSEFTTDYDVENPITRKDAVMSFGMLRIMYKKRVKSGDDNDSPAKKAANQFKAMRKTRVFKAKENHKINFTSETTNDPGLDQGELLEEKPLKSSQENAEEENKEGATEIEKSREKSIQSHQEQEHKHEHEDEKEIENFGSPSKDPLIQEEALLAAFSNSYVSEDSDGILGALPQPNKDPHPSIMKYQTDFSSNQEQRY